MRTCFNITIHLFLLLTAPYIPSIQSATHRCDDKFVLDDQQDQQLFLVIHIKLFPGIHYQFIS